MRQHLLGDSRDSAPVTNRDPTRTPAATALNAAAMAGAVPMPRGG